MQDQYAMLGSRLKEEILSEASEVSFETYVKLDQDGDHDVNENL